MATMPPAPGLFCTTTGCFQSWPSFSVMTRSSASGPLPGGNGVTMLTARVGKSACAWAHGAAPSVAAAMAAVMRVRRASGMAVSWVMVVLAQKNGRLATPAVGDVRKSGSRRAQPRRTPVPPAGGCRNQRLQALDMLLFL